MSQLLVYANDGMTAYTLEVNGNDRIEICEADATPHEIVNVPDEAPEEGGRFPVYNAGGTQFLIDFENKGGGGGPIFADYIGPTSGEAGQAAFR